MLTFLRELKRRNVFKIGAAYVIAAWLLIQVASIVIPAYHAPDWVMPVFVTLISLGFPIALILAWAFEMTPAGVKRTDQLDEAALPVGQAPFAPMLEKPERKVLANSVAVLPFENMSPRPEDANFAAGLHEEILNRLAKISTLNVIARTSVLRYKD